MASVDFHGKCKGPGEAKALFRHCCKDSRLQSKHSNKDINKSLTDTNVSLYKLSYKELCEKYDRRIQELDSTTNKNKRKDRVTLCCLEIPTPSGLPESKERAFFAGVAKVLQDYYGKENLLEATVHRDEKHKYIDSRTGKEVESRVHGHFFEIPEHDGKLNGKWFTSLRNINTVNSKIHEMCEREFGIPFLLGAAKEKHKTVEQLKEESAIAAIEQAKQREKELAAREAAQEAREAAFETERVRILEEQENAFKGRLDDLEAASKAKQEKLQAEYERAVTEAVRGLSGGLVDFCRKMPYYAQAKTKSGQEVGKPTGITILQQYEDVTKRRFSRMDERLDEKQATYQLG